MFWINQNYLCLAFIIGLFYSNASSHNSFRLSHNSCHIQYNITAHYFHEIIRNLLFFQCSVTCGKGVKTRNLICKTRYFQVVDASYCSVKRKPKTQKECSRRPCSNFAWKRTSWTQVRYVKSGSSLVRSGMSCTNYCCLVV